MSASHVVPGNQSPPLQPAGIKKGRIIIAMHFQSSLRLITRGLTLALVPASAQDAPPATRPFADLVVDAERTLIVPKTSAAATKTDTPLLETPQSVSVVTRAEIEARGAQSVAQALGYTPGLVIGQGGEDSRVDEVLIRGFDAGGFSNNVYLDGLRVPAGGQWTRTQVDLFGLESVEVLKGPSAVLFGQVAPGGLVNMVSKRPTGDTRGLASIQYGSFDTLQVAVDSSGPLDGAGKFLYRVAGLYRDGGSQIDHTDLERFYIAPSFTWNIGENTSLTFLASRQEDRGGSTYQFLPVKGALNAIPGYGKMKQGTFIGEPDHNTFNRDQSTIGYELKHRFNDTFSLEQNLRYAEIDTHYDGVVGGTRGAQLEPDATGLWTRRAVTGIGEAHNLTLDTRLRADFSTGPVEHNLIVGFDYIRSSWEHQRTGATVTPINIFNPVYSGTAAFPAFALQVDQDVKEHQRGFYIQEQMTWDRWHLTLGGRYDDTDINLLNTNPATGVRTRTRTSAEEFTGRAGLLYLFDFGLAPYVSYATSFEPVSGTDRNGRAFDPTEGEQLEIGLKYEPKNFNALFTLSLFELTQQNILTRDPVDATFQTQTGEVEIRGVEFETKITLTEGLSLIGGFALTESEITRNNDGNKGNEFAGVPGQSASLWLDYTFQDGPLAGLGLGAGVRYVGSRYGDNGNQFVLPSYTLIDAAIRYDLGRLHSSLEGAHVSLSAANLADKTYVAKAETVSSANYGPGRAVNLNLSYAW